MCFIVQCLEVHPIELFFFLVCFRNIFTIVLGIDLFLDKNARKQNTHLQLAENPTDNKENSVRFNHPLPKTFMLLLIHALA